MLLRSIIVGLLLIFSAESFSQDDKLSSHFKEVVGIMNLKYKRCPDLIETEILSAFYAPRSNSGYLGGPFYALKAKTDDVLITVNFLNATPLLANPQKHQYKDYGHIIKLNYLIDTRPLFIEKNGLRERIKRDSIFHKSKAIKLFKKKKLEFYGADDAGIITVPTDNSYLNKYEKLKVFFMYKSGIGEVYIHYFYKEGTNIDKYIRLTRHMLTF